MLNVQNNNGRSTLHLAAFNGHTAVLKAITGSITTQQLYHLLILQDSDGDTAIALAAYNGHTETIQYILNVVDADKRSEILKVQDKEAQTVLHSAADGGLTTVFEVILNSVTDEEKYSLLLMKEKREISVFQLSILRGQTSIMECIKRFVSPDTWYSLLTTEDTDGNNILLVSLSNRYSDVAIFIVASLADEDVFEFLCIEGLNGKTALHIAAHKGLSDVVISCLTCVTHGQLQHLLAKKDKDRHNVLFEATTQGHTEVVKYLTDKIDIEIRFDMITSTDVEGSTGVHLAALSGHTDTIVTILHSLTTEQVHQLLTTQDNKGNTPIAAAASRGHIETLRLVLNAGDSTRVLDLLNVLNYDGQTALHLAVSCGQLEAFRSCVEDKVSSEQWKEFVALEGNQGTTANQVVSEALQGDSSGDGEGAKSDDILVDNSLDGLLFSLNISLTKGNDTEANVKIVNQEITDNTLHQLFEASKRGDVDMLSYLLSHSSDTTQLLLQVDRDNCTALHYAKNRDTAQLLVESVRVDKQQKFLGLTPSSRFQTALDAAASDNRLDVVEYLCAFNPNGEIYRRLMELIRRLKDCHVGDEPDVESKVNLFKELSFVYESDVNNAAQDAFGVVIEYFWNLKDNKEFIQYHRLTAVYDRNMYNKFLVPIWAAAKSKDQSEGYILWPKLAKLEQVITDLKKAKIPPKRYCEELNEVLRLCFAPVALAIDALHAPVLNKRATYHHRDVCIDNVYMDVHTSVDSTGNTRREYDEARLKLTTKTREAFKLPSEADESPPSTQLLSAYYHHDEVKFEEESYSRQHDWYSFGVYILEVLSLALADKDKSESGHAEDYTNVSRVVSLIEESDEVKSMHLYLYQLVDIAEKCIHLGFSKQQEVSHEIPLEMRERFVDHKQAFTMHFEYGISACTAQLLWMYEDLRSRTPDGSSLCQACLLHSKDKIATKQHSHGNKTECDETCQHYCLHCYTSGERLFCTKGHGTAGTLVDHRHSYALILYGESFEDVCREERSSTATNPFAREATRLAQTLQQPLLCGLPEANVHVEAVYGQEGMTPEDCLKRHCEEMRKLIHRDGSTICKTSYILFTFYIGHSYHGHDKTVGDWCPAFRCTAEGAVEPIRLRSALISQHLASIQICSNPKVSPIECQASCLSVNLLVNPCGPAPGSTRHQWSSGREICLRRRDRPLLTTSAGALDVTEWFSQMLRSLYYNKCSTTTKGSMHFKMGADQSPSGGDVRCRVPLGKIDVCFKLARYIYEELGEAFIDGECLRIHQKHFNNNGGYTNLHVSVDDEHFKPILAYYNPQGLFFNVFSRREGEDEVSIDWKSGVNCDGIKQVILNQIKHGKNYRDKKIRILLFSANQSEYLSVTDDNIKGIAGFSPLFYLAVVEERAWHILLKREMIEHCTDFIKEI